jgi:hypothetical protein
MIMKATTKLLACTCVVLTLAWSMTARSSTVVGAGIGAAGAALTSDVGGAVGEGIGGVMAEPESTGSDRTTAGFDAT